MTPDQPTALVEVTQGDREAAISWCRSTPHGSRHAEADIIERGDYDDHSLVQAFARHRVVALEEAAQIAEQYPSLDGAAIPIVRGIALAIRKAKEGRG